MYDALYEYCPAAGGHARRRDRACCSCACTARRRASSAAAHFRRLARPRGLAMTRWRPGTEPDAELAPGAVKGLAGGRARGRAGAAAAGHAYDLDSAARIVSFGCDVTPAKGQPIDQWDVPAVSDGYEAARERIVDQVERLVAELAEDADMPLQQRRASSSCRPMPSSGGFDHAAVHESTGRIYVAHTANDAIDVIDIEDAEVHRLHPGTPGGGGRARGRGATTWSSRRIAARTRRRVRAERPSGRRQGGRRRSAQRPGVRSERAAAARGPRRRSGHPGSCTVSIVDVASAAANRRHAGRRTHALGRLRSGRDAFHVNIADPPQIVVDQRREIWPVRRVVDDSLRRAARARHRRHASPAVLRLRCGSPARGGRGQRQGPRAARPIAGVPDVVFFNAALEPSLRRDRRPGRHRGVRHDAAPPPGDRSRRRPAPTRCRSTPTRNIVCAFLPGSHRAAVYRDLA